MLSARHSLNFRHMHTGRVRVCTAMGSGSEETEEEQLEAMKCHVLPPFMADVENYVTRLGLIAEANGFE